MAVFLIALRALWPYLLGAVLVMGAYAFVHHQGVLSERKNTVKVQAQLDAEVAAHAADVQRARAYAAKLVLEWNAATDRAETNAKDLANERAKSFAGYATAARSLPGRAVVVGSAYVGLLNSAIHTANAGITPATPAEPGQASAPATDLGHFADWSVQVVELYSACAQQVKGLQDFYTDLRVRQQAAQPKE